MTNPYRTNTRRVLEALAAMAVLMVLWGLFGWLDYGLFIKRDNDFCLMWSRDPWGKVTQDWCDKWRQQDITEAIIMSFGGPLALPAAAVFASMEAPFMLEYTRIPHAYPGQGVER